MGGGVQRRVPLRALDPLEGPELRIAGQGVEHGVVYAVQRGAVAAEPDDSGCDRRRARVKEAGKTIWVSNSCGKLFIFNNVPKPSDLPFWENYVSYFWEKNNISRVVGNNYNSCDWGEFQGEADITHIKTPLGGWKEDYTEEKKKWDIIKCNNGVGVFELTYEGECTGETFDTKDECWHYIKHQGHLHMRQEAA